MNSAKWAGLVASALLAFTPAAWAAGKKETHVTMDQLPAAAKATIEQESEGARVGEIQMETQGGQTFYEAEIVKNGRASYIHVSGDGKVLKRETAEQERKSEGAKARRVAP